MAWSSLSVLLADQGTKWAILAFLSIHDNRPVLEGFFRIVHVRNRGMAFGFMNSPTSNLSLYFLISASIGAILLLFFWLIRLKDSDRPLTFGLSLILGGAAGNLVDRIRFGEVIDFLDFFVGAYHWPAFNVADSAITVGTFWVALCLIFRRRPAQAEKIRDG
jgi:signal peptidase II